MDANYTALKKFWTTPAPKAIIKLGKVFLKSNEFRPIFQTHFLCRRILRLFFAIRFGRCRGDFDGAFCFCFNRCLVFGRFAVADFRTARNAFYIHRRAAFLCWAEISNTGFRSKRRRPRGDARSNDSGVGGDKTSAKKSRARLVISLFDGVF